MEAYLLWLPTVPLVATAGEKELSAPCSLVPSITGAARNAVVRRGFIANSTSFRKHVALDITQSVQRYVLD